MALADEKLVTLNNLAELIKHLERDIPAMTMEYYNAHKSEIPKNTYFCITDDSPQMSDMQEAQVTSDDLDELINEIEDDEPVEDNGEFDDLFT